MMKIEDVARQLNVTERSIYNWIKLGYIKQDKRGYITDESYWWLISKMEAKCLSCKLHQKNIK